MVESVKVEQKKRLDGFRLLEIDPVGEIDKSIRVGIRKEVSETFGVIPRCGTLFNR